MKRIAILSLIVGIPFLNLGFSQTQPPLINTIGDIEIINHTFVSEYEGENYSYAVPEEDLDEYRVAILTLKIDKEPGEVIEIAAADITLHYYYGENGEDEEVAPCDALSVFSTISGVDRTLKTVECSPGWLKRQTGTSTIGSSVVYIDVAFRLIEPNISRMWICVAEPKAMVTTTGWTP